MIPRRSAIVVIKVLAGQETGVHGNPLIRKDRRVLQAEIVMFWHEAKPHFIEISLFQFLKSLLDDLGFLKGKCIACGAAGVMRCAVLMLKIEPIRSPHRAVVIF